MAFPVAAFLAGTLGSAVIGAVGSLVGGSSAAKASNQNAETAKESAEKTNEANLQAVRETNATNREINDVINATNLNLAKQQNEWNVEQWNRENQYNSPENQVQLYKAAGLNPALANGNFTPAQHLQSADLAVMQPYSENAPQFDDPEKAAQFARQQAVDAKLQGQQAAVESFKNIARDTLEVKKTESEIVQREFSTLFTKQGIDYYKNLTHSILEKTRGDKLQNDFFEKVSPDMALHYQIQTGIYEQSLINLKQDTAIKEGMQRLQGIQAQIEEVNKKLLEIELQYAEKMKSSQIQYYYSEAQKNFVETQGLSIVNEFRNKNFGFSPSDVMNRRIAGIQGQTQRAVATINRESSKYSADMHFNTAKYQSENSLIRDWGRAGIMAIGVGIGFSLKPAKFVKYLEGLRKQGLNNLSAPKSKGLLDKNFFGM